MNLNKFVLWRFVILRFCLLAVLMVGAASTQASTLWSGPNITFSHAAGSSTTDPILPGVVELTRGINNVLYNVAAGETFAGASSPADTEWAFGTTNHISDGTLVFQSMSAIRAASGFDTQASLLGKQMVCHIKSADIYFAVMFTDWERFFSGAFTYVRATPNASGPPPTPTVSITSPADGASFAVSADVPISANASVSSGTITNVSFFDGTTQLGVVTSSPFNFTASGLSPGSHSLTAVATAAGVSATSSVVHITIVAHPTVSLTAPTNGAVFATPANVQLSANASVNGGTITNVTFFNGTTQLGSVTSSPFNFNAQNLAAGSYSLTAVATAGGVSATSTPVSISVVAPVAVSSTAAKVAAGNFSFNYSVNPGLTYVVQVSSDLRNWTPVVTNVPNSSTANFSTSINPGGPQFYRVVRLANP